MSLAEAFDTLAAISVTGVRRSYTLADLRGGTWTAELPCLLPLPQEGESTRTAYGYVATSFEDRDVIRHRLLVAPEETVNMGEAMAKLVDLIDSYKTALKTLVTHDGADEMDFRRYEAGVVAWGGHRYHGADIFVEVVLND